MGRAARPSLRFGFAAALFLGLGRAGKRAVVLAFPVAPGWSRRAAPALRVFWCAAAIS